MSVYRVGEVTVTVDHEARTITHAWDDGLELVVRPRIDEAPLTDFDRARHLGYCTDTETGWSVSTAELWEMHRDHELAHHFLAVSDGWAWSPVLHRIAKHGPPARFQRDEYAAEERAVLAFQLGLDKRPGAGRPWDGAAQ